MSAVIVYGVPDLKIMRHHLVEALWFRNASLVGLAPAAPADRFISHVLRRVAVVTMKDHAGFSFDFLERAFL